MAKTATHQVQVEAGGDASSYATGSFTPPADSVLVAAVENSHGTAATLPTLSGHGTWEQMDSQLSAAGTERLTVFRTKTSGSPSAGAVTADFGATTQTGCSIHVASWADVDASGANGENAFGVPVGDIATAALSLTLNLSSSGAASGAYGAFRKDEGDAVTVGSGFTQLRQGSHGAPAAVLLTEWRADTDSTVDASEADTTNWIGIAFEVLAAPVTVSLGLPTEADSGAAASAAKAFTGGLSTETDEAFVASAAKAAALELTAETDETFPMSKLITLGLVVETDTAFGLALPDRNPIRLTLREPSRHLVLREVAALTIRENA